MDRAVRRKRIEVRRYREGDEGAIKDLFRASFGQELPEGYWEWRFRDNPAGRAVIELAWDGDLLAGHYAVSPVATQIGGREVRTGLSGTTMTHPQYRGMGLFVTLAVRTYQRMEEEGYGAVWGFPNSSSHRTFIDRLDWSDIHELPTLRVSVAESRAPAPASHIEEVTAFDERFDALWDRVAGSLAVSTIRSSDFLAWRFARCPSEAYQTIASMEDGTLSGYAVFKRYGEELQIIDLLYERHETGLELISNVIESARRASVPSVSLWLNLWSPLHRVLEKVGFRNGDPVTYFGARSFQESLIEARIYDFPSWHIARCDSDVY